MVGASGAIAGVLGGYLVLYPRVRVDVLVPVPFLWPIISVPAFMMLLWWIGIQVLSALPQLNRMDRDVATGVAFFAHIGGFVAGVALVKLFRAPLERHPTQRDPPRPPSGSRIAEYLRSKPPVGAPTRSTGATGRPTSIVKRAPFRSCLLARRAYPPVRAC